MARRTETASEIPQINLGDLQTMDDFRQAAEERRAYLGRAIVEAYHTVGFAFVRAPRELNERLDDMYNDWQKVFALPDDVKMKYWGGHHRFQRGFTPVNSEQALFCKRTLVEGEVDRRPVANFAENWFVATEGIENSERAAEFPLEYLPNVWPDEVPSTSQTTMPVHQDLMTMDEFTMKAAEPVLGLDSGYFTDRNGDAPTLMRLLHYPPAHESDIRSGAVVGACQHTDINDRTWLPRSRSHGPGRGLEVRSRWGEWIPGKAPEGYVITQVGDMFQHSTGGYFLSAQHRVESPIIEKGNRVGRYSCALFIGPRPDYDIGNIIDLSHLTDSQKHYRHVTAADSLGLRLDKIGLAGNAQ